MIPDKLYDLLRRLEDDSNALGIPAISKEDGTLLAGLAFSQCTARPGLIVDAGAGIGYSTAWLALGALAGKGCRILAIEYNSKLYSYLANAARQISRYVPVEPVNDNALNVLRETSGITLLFVDVEKHHYPEVLGLAEKSVEPGGIIAFHNAFFPPPPREFYEKIEETGWPAIAVPTLAGGILLVRRTA